MSESIIFTLKFAAVGITIVFAVLAIISIVIALMRRGDEVLEKRNGSEPDKESEQNIDNTTLVLIAAAAATMIKGRFHIKRVRKLMSRDTVKGPWSLQGRAILLGSHVINKGKN